MLRFRLVKFGQRQYADPQSSITCCWRGGSTPLLVKELLATCTAAAGTPAIKTIWDGWRRQDRTAGLETWQQELTGLEEPTRVA